MDGVPAGRDDGLSVAHRYDLSQSLSPGRHHLAIRVDNSKIADIGFDCSSGSDQTAGTWNGLVGRIELQASPPVWIDDVQIFPNVARKSARVLVAVRNRLNGIRQGTLTIEVQAFNTARVHHVPSH